jgi:hypothetical protein
MPCRPCYAITSRIGIGVCYSEELAQRQWHTRSGVVGDGHDVQPDRMTRHHSTPLVTMGIEPEEVQSTKLLSRLQGQAKRFRKPFQKRHKTWRPGKTRRGPELEERLPRPGTRPSRRDMFNCGITWRQPCGRQPWLRPSSRLPWPGPWPCRRWLRRCSSVPSRRP